MKTFELFSQGLKDFSGLKKGVCQEFCVNRFNKQHRIAA